MVDSDPQQQHAPPVPESDESTTTNPSMNGLEASNLPALPPQATASSSASSSALPPLEVELPHLRAALSMEEAAAQDAAANANVNADPQRQPSAESTKSGTGKDNASAGDGNPKEAVEEKRVGCAHYKRRAKFVTPCCNKLYMCRYCHDESETHYFNRKTVTQLICTECDTRQRVQAECEKCGVRFGKVSNGWVGLSVLQGKERISAYLHIVQQVWIDCENRCLDDVG